MKHKRHRWAVALRNQSSKPCNLKEGSDMNVTPNVARCDRMALYATRDGSRTKDQPVRAGAEVPMRFEQDGAEFVLLAVITPTGDETADAAILREIREKDAELMALLEDAA